MWYCSVRNKIYGALKWQIRGRRSVHLQVLRHHVALPGNSKWKSTVSYCLCDTDGSSRGGEGRECVRGVRAVTVSARGGAKTLGSQFPPFCFGRTRWSGPLLHLPREMKQFYLLISKAQCARYDQRQGKLWRRLPVLLLHYINSHFLFIQDKNAYAYQPNKFHKYEHYVKRTNFIG